MLRAREGNSYEECTRGVHERSAREERTRGVYERGVWEECMRGAYAYFARLARCFLASALMGFSHD
jgi:hypothetical protein